jgi:hypothetical protein
MIFLCLFVFGGQALADNLNTPTEPSAIAGAIAGTLPHPSVAPRATIPVSVGQYPSTPTTTATTDVAAPLATTTTTSDVTSVSKTAAAAIDAAAKTAEPAIKATTANIAAQRIEETVAPARTEETVAPAIQATRRTVITTTESALGSATATVAKESAPVLAVAEGADRGATGRVSQAPSVVSGIVRSVAHDATTAATASEDNIESTESALTPRKAALGIVSRDLPTPPTGALASKASGRQTQPMGGGGLPILQSSPSGSAETPELIASGSAGAEPTKPAGAPSALPACAGSALRPAAEALIVSCASAGSLPLSSVSAAQLLEPLIGAEHSAATFSSAGTAAGGHLGAGSSVGAIPAAPIPTPLPLSSSSATASGVGVAFSIFLTLAGLLLIGGLAAMRLLRLASDSWRMAQFVLVPERPG